MLLLNLQFVYSVSSVKIYLLPTLACEFSLISMLSPIFPRELPRRSPLQICRIGLQDRHARSRFSTLTLKGRVERNFPFTVTYLTSFTLFDIKYPHDAFRTIAIFNPQLLGCSVSFTYFWYTVQDVFSRVFCW